MKHFLANTSLGDQQGRQGQQGNIHSTVHDQYYFSF